MFFNVNKFFFVVLAILFGAAIYRSQPINMVENGVPDVDELYNICLEKCPVTAEYNPICGTDNIDYTNPGSLGCAQRCGEDVILKHYGRCST